MPINHVKGEHKMNLSANPTLDQLRHLLAAQDDTTGLHAIWVDNHGNVYISTYIRNTDGSALERMLENSRRFSYRVWTPESGFVGEEAANDDNWVRELFDDLLKDWQTGTTGLVDTS